MKDRDRSFHRQPFAAGIFVTWAAATALGGDIYVDAGGKAASADAKRRTWVPDAPFLAGAAATEVADWPGQEIDNRLLTDRDVPPEVLRSERTGEAEIHYRIPAGPGDHTVVLYFSENCAACVQPALGGTATTETVELTGSFILGPAEPGASLPRQVPITYRLRFPVESTTRSPGPSFRRLEVATGPVALELRGDPTGFLGSVFAPAFTGSARFALTRDLATSTVRFEGLEIGVRVSPVTYIFSLAAAEVRTELEADYPTLAGFGAVPTQATLKRLVGTRRPPTVEEASGPATVELSPRKAARLFDVEVQGQRVEAYNPADAASGDPADGLGATFVATELVFRVRLKAAGPIDIRLIDRGGGDYPGNAGIHALAVLEAGPPQAPTDLRVRPGGSGLLRLNWSDSSVDEEGFSIERSTGGAFEPIADLPPGSVFFTDRVPSWQSPCYRVRSYNAHGDSGPSASACGESTALDLDGDGVLDDGDNCPGWHNPSQSDADGDGVGDVCEEAGQAVRFARADSNDDGRVNISDVSFTLGFLFLGSGAPSCEDAADADDSGRINITDPVFTLGCLFLGTGCPPSPYPGCGEDTTPDTLSCPAASGCGGGVRIQVQVAIRPTRPSLPGLDGGPPRRVAALVWPGGERQEFAADEVVFRPQDPADLQAFLSRYGGVVLRDGTPFIPPELGPPPHPATSSGLYLVRVDPARSAMDDVAGNLGRLGLEGALSFSSQEALRLYGIVARERGRKLAPNYLAASTGYIEHPVTPSALGTHMNPADFGWMMEDNRVLEEGDQGLSTGVVHAWDYMRYHGVPPTNGIFDPVNVAVIDAGFALDPDTSHPHGGNPDYFLPVQADAVDHDSTAGGASGIAGGEWHGQAAFGVCCARVGNGFGWGGTGGQVTRPWLIRDSGCWYTLEEAIRFAAIFESDIITISQEVTFPAITPGPYRDLVRDEIQQAVYTAVSFGAIVVAGAGNAGTDLSGRDHILCTIDTVICVGAVDYVGRNVESYGSPVDIWAPTDIFTTVTPISAARDADNLDPDELYEFSGTSASTPFVAGIIAMMNAFDPGLKWDEALEILQSTANPAPGGASCVPQPDEDFAWDPTRGLYCDPRVRTGIVDAYRAVNAVRVNQPPVATFHQPADGATVSYIRVGLYAVAQDPESGVLPSWRTSYRSDVDGPVCSGYCWPVRLSPGLHLITATAADPHGATGSASIAVNAVNTPPQVEITSVPPAPRYAGQLLTFHGWALDTDEGSLPASQLVWTSSLDGVLGSGATLVHVLSQGTHLITLTATDELGLTGAASVAIDVQAGQGAPSAQILAPLNDSANPLGQAITFTGLGTDPEDGNLPGSSLSWYSNHDGFLGTGETLQAQLTGDDCFVIEHTVTLRVTDSDGKTAETRIRVYVGSNC